MSRILDANPQAAELVLTDLLAGGIDPAKGRGGLNRRPRLMFLALRRSWTGSLVSSACTT
jgi:hypothetical protein